MLRAVLDPGVLIAALLSLKGVPAQIVRRWVAGDFELVASPLLLDELQRVLKQDKFRRYFSIEEAKEYVALFDRFALVIPDPPPESGLTPDPGDDYLVSLAPRVAGARFLVSGDAHLTGLDDPNPPVLTPRDFLMLLTGTPPEGERDA